MRAVSEHLLGPHWGVRHIARPTRNHTPKKTISLARRSNSNGILARIGGQRVRCGSRFRAPSGSRVGNHIGPPASLSSLWSTFGYSIIASRTTTRSFPPPWTAEPIPGRLQSEGRKQSVSRIVEGIGADGLERGESWSRSLGRPS